MSLPAELLDLSATIAPRPYRVPATERPIWRSVLVVMMIPYCHGGAGSRTQLHALYWAARSDNAVGALAKYLNKDLSSLFVPVRVDPSTDLAIALSASSGLMEPNQRGRYEQTDEGARFSERVKSHGVFRRELERLDRLPKKLSVGAADSLWRAR